MTQAAESEYVYDVDSFTHREVATFLNSPCFLYFMEALETERIKVSNQLSELLRDDNVADAALGYARTRFYGGQLMVLDLCGDLKASLEDRLKEVIHE